MTLFGKKKAIVHLVSYEMPDGYNGRGFVNGPLTWSFIGEELKSIADDDLFRAYCGWAWIFPALQAHTISTDFEPEHLAQFVKSKETEGYKEIVVVEKYKIGTSELVTYTSIKDNTEIHGACILDDHDLSLEYGSSDSRSKLPMEYYLIGDEALKS